MSADPQIWILDDGELVEIRSLLTEAGIAFGEGPAVPGTRVRLLVTSARRTLLDQEKRPSSDTHLVVFEESTRGLRKVLERSGCDLVMALPLNAHAFRLVLNHCLYQGPEKRRSRRVMLGSTIKLKRGLSWSNGTLVSLSLRGCGLNVDVELRVGREQELKLPAKVTGRGELRLNGRVLSSRPAESGGYDTALAFRLIDPGDRRVVVDILNRHGGGAELRPRTSPAEREPDTGAQVEGGPEGEEAGERRRGKRKRFTRRVLAAGAGVSHVLIGRDLSAGGMRVRPDPELDLGDALKLAVHGHPGQPAIMVKATVIRDDGDDGIVLRFDDLPDSIASRLEEMVSRLPSLPPGKRSGSQTANVVSEVLGRD
jgi:hypothetical protein